MNYLHWNQTTITDFSEESIAQMYDEGYVFTRLGKGVMQQTRSARVDLAKFELSSENRRVMGKVADLKLEVVKLPFEDYDWSIGKLAKDFYETKFGKGIMSAQKVKEMLTEPESSNFNALLEIGSQGYAVCYAAKSFLHYSYPFYDLEASPKDMGLGMMLRAIEYAKKAGMRYIYLGSLQRPRDTYKLQFKGLEWFDGKIWQTDLEAVKKLLISAKIG